MPYPGEGTLAGYCEDKSRNMGGYSGIARAAKIAFFDIGDALNRLFVPSNLSLKMLLPGTFNQIQHAAASLCVEIWTLQL